MPCLLPDDSWDRFQPPVTLKRIEAGKEKLSFGQLKVVMLVCFLHFLTSISQRQKNRKLLMVLRKEGRPLKQVCLKASLAHHLVWVCAHIYAAIHNTPLALAVLVLALLVHQEFFLAKMMKKKC